MISIIVPVYNVEEYLEECLTSIQHQTFTDIEVILVNDGSLMVQEKYVNNIVKKISVLG